MRSKVWREKISESIKQNWVVRRKKYGNSDGCRNPEVKNRKISEAHKGKLVVPLGTVPWNKGIKDIHFSPETEFKQGLIPWNKGIKGIMNAWNKGVNGYTSKPASEERKQRIREKLIGNKNNLGKHPSEETIIKMRKSSATRLAKQPHKDTKPELVMAMILDSLQINYIRQRAIDTCIPDFYVEPNICVFVDGVYWHNRPEIAERDQRVNAKLIELGYKVIRFWDNEIYQKPEYCKAHLLTHLP